MSFKVLVRTNTSAEVAGICQDIIELASQNPMNSPRPKRAPKAKPLRKATSSKRSIPERPPEPTPPVKIDPNKVVVYPPSLPPHKVRLVIAASPTETKPTTPRKFPRLPSLPPIEQPRQSWTWCGSCQKD